MCLRPGRLWSEIENCPEHTKLHEICKARKPKLLKRNMKKARWCVCATDFQHSRPASNEKGHRPAKVEPYYPLTMHSKTFRGSSSEVQVTTHTFPEQVLLKTTHVHIYHPVHASLCIDGIGRSTSAPLWIAWCTLGEKAQLSRSAASRSLALTRSLLPTHGTTTTWEESIKHRTYKYLGAEKSHTTVRCPFSVHVQGKHGTSATIWVKRTGHGLMNTLVASPLPRIASNHSQERVNFQHELNRTEK